MAIKTITLSAISVLLAQATFFSVADNNVITTQNKAKIAHIEANPSTTVFVFDLHDVLFDLSTKNKLKGFFGCTEKMRVLKARKQHKEYLQSCTNPEDPMLCFEYVMKKDDGSINQSTLAMMNGHEPIDESIALLRRLKKNGYKLFLCSNIGERSYDYLVNKYKEIFSLFDGKRICTHENNYVTKASPKAFEECKKIIESVLDQPVKHIVMIDDCADKLANAEKAAMITIKFTTPIDLKRLLTKFVN